MDSADSPANAERRELTPKALTDRLASLERGDRIRFNDRDEVFEVVHTDRYAVTVVDDDENRYTFSQNLQTGGWDVHETAWWVATVDDE